jgi:TQXA domain-containing protein
MLISTVFSSIPVLAAASDDYDYVGFVYRGNKEGADSDVAQGVSILRILNPDEWSSVTSKDYREWDDAAEETGRSHVVYCYTSTQQTPKTAYTLASSNTTGTHKKVIADENTFLNDTQLVRDGITDLKKEIMKLYYYGYPNDKANIFKKYNLSDEASYVVTQCAIWYYCGTGFLSSYGTIEGLSTNARNAFEELVDVNHKLAYPSADDYTLYMYEAKNYTSTASSQSVVQNLLSVELIDKDGNPADAEDIAPGGTSKETTAQTTETKATETQATEKQTDAKVDNEVITMVDQATVTTDSETPATSSTEAPKPEEPDNDVIVMVDKATVTTDSETPATSSTEAPKPEETEAPDNDVIIMVDKETTVTPDPGTPTTPDTETPNTDETDESEAPDNDVIVMVDQATTEPTPDTPETVTVSLSKQDAAGAELPGASVEVKDANETVIDSWTSETTPHTIEVEPGSYWFIETAAPEGYKTATSINFIVGEDKSITVGGVKLESDAPVVMVDDVADKPDDQEKVTVKLSKQDIEGKELAGAQVKVEAADGTEIDRWISETEVHTIEVEPGSYKFIETAAPEGYKIATTIEFTVDKDGTITVGDKKLESDAPVVMVDDVADKPDDQGKVTVNLSKQDAAGAELPGASVEVKDANETVIDSWTSETTPHTIEVEPGSYWFIEVAAPKGYKTATSINFIVGEDKSITVGAVKLESDAPIVMVDDALDIPDTPEKVTVKLSKTDNSGNGLAGAQVKVEAADGTEIDSWTSETTPHTIEVEPGSYKFIETAAPEKYVLAKDIEFTVDQDGIVTVGGVKLEGDAPVVMVDELITAQTETDESETQPTSESETTKQSETQPTSESETTKQSETQPTSESETTKQSETQPTSESETTKKS